MTTTHWHPGTILETSGYYWRTCTLHAGVNLDVFTKIGENALTAEETAEQIGGEARATAMLLDALSAMDLLKKEGDRYANTEASGSYLSQESPKYIGYMIKHHHHLVPSWSRLHEAVKTGGPVRERASFSDPEVRESFLMGMFNNAMLQAPLVAESVDLPERGHLLDLGGGPGTYAIHFCLKHPNLRATVYDLGTTRPFAEKTVERFDLSERIRFEAGDYTDAESLGGPYDAAWLSHILHGEGPETGRAILRKAAAALSRGGLLLIHEFILDNSRDTPLFPALFSLNMLLGTDGGQAYSEGELTEMMTEAGLRDIRRLPFRGPTDSGILQGRR